jgi:divalent metal cation (Fe/Co/Zn/Cd) transporter
MVTKSERTYLFWAAAVTLAIVLASIALLWLVYHNPILESDLIALGIWIFFLIIFLACFAVYRDVAPQLRAGRLMYAAKQARDTLLTAVLVAIVMGVLCPLSIAQPYVLPLLLLLTSLLPRFHEMWMRRKT